LRSIFIPILVSFQFYLFISIFVNSFPKCFAFWNPNSVRFQSNFGYAKIGNELFGKKNWKRILFGIKKWKENKKKMERKQKKFGTLFLSNPNCDLFSKT